MNRRLLKLTACLCAAQVVAWAGELPPLQLHWSELAPRVEGRKVSFLLPDATHVEGRVIGVESGGLRMKVTKSSHRASQPKGKQLVPRQGLTALEVTEYRKIGRLVGTLGVLGLAGGVIAAQQIDIYEGPAVILVPVMIAVAVVGAGVAGYFIGKRIDKRVVQIKILPDSPSQPGDSLDGR